ncbi:phospholipase A [Methylibium sp.]|uniref:phospholipase A n=1 Tax=Methylibium sp. TaxID=2067992 RepID=UPI003D0AB41E
MSPTALSALLLALPFGAALAQQDALPTLADCAALSDDGLRLACYDHLAGREAPAVPTVPAGRTPDVMARPTPPIAGTGLQGPPTPAPSFLSKYWELDEADKRGTFNFTGYRPNFLLPVHATTRINTRPTSPTPGRSGQLGDYKKVEGKLQLSLRTKVAQSVLLPGADLWFGYTQQSLWQLYNPGDSAPFRSSDYEPEMMYVVPVPEGLRALPWGWQWRYGMVAFAHQSNGQTVPLSRSWNRVYAGAGFERNDTSVMLRLNRRVHENPATDDNPDLTDYRGRGDVTLNWTPGRATAALSWRTNFRDLKRGAVQFDWTYPVEPDSPRALRWYVQLFSGYGETLLDYNFRQTSLGLGLTLFEF